MPGTVGSGIINKPFCSSRISSSLNEPNFLISSSLIIIEFNGAEDNCLSILLAETKTSSKLKESTVTSFCCENKIQENKRKYKLFLIINFSQIYFNEKRKNNGESSFFII